jgi:sugar phosphate isomerase/epimerase
MTGTAADRISCSTYAYGHWDFGRALESIARVGYTGVEILTHGVGRPDGQGGRQMNYHLRPEWPEERIAAAEELLGRLRLQAVCLSPSTDFLEPRHGSVQADVDEVCRHVDLAVRLGALLVRPFAANTLPEGMDAETAVGRIAEALRTCGDYAASRGVRLAVENHGRFPGESRNMVAILRAADHPAVGLCLHIPRPTAEELIDAAPDKIWHMHLGAGWGWPQRPSRRAAWPWERAGPTCGPSCRPLAPPATAGGGITRAGRSPTRSRWSSAPTPT